ncbi:hypothetical protein Tco_1425109 [Tanacetum coccineum]
MLALQVTDTGCRLLPVAGPLFLQFLGASFTQGTVSSIPIVGSIIPEGFLPPIPLLVVIIVTVVIVAVILVVVVVAIVGVVIVVAIIGVVVVAGAVSFIIKLSFVIIGFEAVTFPSILLGNPPMKASRSFSVFGTMFGNKTANSWNLLILLNSVQVILLARSIPIGWAYAFHQDKASSVRVPVANVTLFSSAYLLRENTDSIHLNQRMRSSSRSGVPVGIASTCHYSSGTGSVPGGRVDLTGDEDPTNEDGYIGMGDSTGVSMYLGGEISSRGKKSQESNIGDSDNTRDGDTIVGGAIGD